MPFYPTAGDGITHRLATNQFFAVFVNDRAVDEGLDERQVPKKVARAFVQMRQSLNPFMLRMARRGFEVKPLFLRPAATMYAWATGRQWRDVIARANMAEGDVAMLIFRTADNLRHVKTLSSIFPQVAASAGQAVDRILREPIRID